MSANKKIAPCPFSKRYLIDEDQAWQSLTVFFLYRLMVGSILAFLFFLQVLPASLGRYFPELYATVASIYLVSIFLSAMPMLLRRPSFSVQAQFQVLVDIALIPFIMHASGGVASGVGVMLGLTVAAGGILIGGRCALAFAALASVAVLAEEVYADLAGLFEQTHFTYAGMLGASYFGIAVLAVVLARRAERTEALAERQSADIANLQQINEFVIQNMQSGILVVDEHGRLRLSNESAARLLPIPPGRPFLASVSPYLAQAFRDWLADSGRGQTLLKIDGLPPIHVRFTRLGQARPPIHMIFLEDSALHSGRVQHSKLASLGRLAASIAHEIRNPLGAISHASQLLAESPVLGKQDRRLIDIILEHSARLNSVIENVLQISRRGEAHREKLPLVATLAEFLRDFGVQHGVDPACFRLDPKAEEFWGLADPSHLQQILENLGSNALKYGNPEVGPITWRILPRQGMVCLDILDHAPPIDAKTALNLFEPFFTTSHTGTGLGLYIARELAELNQARLEYSDMGEG
ncbi:sensor histidine kinase, partial [Methylomagnum sp.]